MYQRKVDVDMLNAVKSVLVDTLHKIHVGLDMIEFFHMSVIAFVAVITWPRELKPPKNVVTELLNVS